MMHSMNNRLRVNKSMGAYNNVCIRVLDAYTGEVIQEHISHNTATNSLLTGIAHYLTGDGILNQGSYMLSQYVPKYISLGTMGLINQDYDDDGLPAGIGEAVPDIKNDPVYRALLEAEADALVRLNTAVDALSSDCSYYPVCEACEECSTCADRISGKKQEVLDADAAYQAAKSAVMSYSEERRFRDYMTHCPGFGADGYDEYLNNSREYFGLGPTYANRPTDATIKCELISNTFPRVDISFRDVVPEIEAELPKTIDVVFSAMISTGALKQFREPDKPYLFITECGLWSKKEWEDSGDNGLLAAYRISPPNEWQRQVVAANLTDDGIRQYLISQGIPNPTAEQIASADREEIAAYNRNILKKHVIRVGLNQVVQVIWKIQLGSIDEFASMYDLRKIYYQIDEEQGNISYVEAVAKLKSIRNKYQSVSGLDAVFEQIDQLQ